MQKKQKNINHSGEKFNQFKLTQNLHRCLNHQILIFIIIIFHTFRKLKRDIKDIKKIENEHLQMKNTLGGITEDQTLEKENVSELENISIEMKQKEGKREVKI